MKLSEKLLIVASWLEDTENDLLLSADEADDNSLSVVANALTKAASALREGAEQVTDSEPSGFNSLQLEEIAAVAEAFDQSEDELLKKQASVLDELLLTLAAPKNAIYLHKKSEDDRIEELKKKYRDIKPQHDEINKVSDAVQKIEKSDAYKTYRPLEAPLSTRYCPDHAGAPIARVGEHTWQCTLDKKIYNYDAGFKTMQGNVVPGGRVEDQTNVDDEHHHTIFETRESKLNQ